MLPFDPDRIADQLRIGAHQLVAFLLPSAYLFRTVFRWFFACHLTASARHPFRVSAGRELRLRERKMIARRRRYFRGRASNPQQRPLPKARIQVLLLRANDLGFRAEPCGAGITGLQEPGYSYSPAPPRSDFPVEPSLFLAVHEMSLL